MTHRLERLSTRIPHRQDWAKFFPESNDSQSQGIQKFDRRGFTLVEMFGTCVLLGVLFSITVPMFVVIARERHATEQRQFALQHAANLLEYATSRPWLELAPGPIDLPEADADLRAVLPGLQRTLFVKTADGEMESRQIVASIQWHIRPGQLVAPILISAWVYRNGDQP